MNRFGIVSALVLIVQQVKADVDCAALVNTNNTEENCNEWPLYAEAFINNGDLTWTQFEV